MQRPWCRGGGGSGGRRRRHAALADGLTGRRRPSHERQHRLADERSRNHRLAELLVAQDAVLHSTTIAGGRVAVVASPSRDAASAVLTGLDAPRRGRTYRLWVIAGRSRYTEVGRLGPGSGTGSVLIDGLGGATTFGVSIEPAGDRDAPTELLGTVELT
jgi:hypothetical protein